MKWNCPARRTLLIAAGVVGLFTTFGFLVLPAIAKTQLEKRLAAALGRRVTVEHVRINPYRLSIAVEGFAIQEQDGFTDFAKWRRLYVNFDAVSSLGGSWVLSEVELDGLSLRGTVNADRSLNVSDVLARLASPKAKPAPAAKASSRPLRVGRLAVAGARLQFEDSSRPERFATTVGPLSFEVMDFETVGGSGAPYRFTAVTEAGEKIVWRGSITAQPLRSSGELRIINVNLPKYAPYYTDLLQGEIASGRLSVLGHYDVDLSGERPAVTLSDATVQLRGFALRESGPGPRLLEFAAVDATGIRADTMARTLLVKALAVTGGCARIRREQDGTINLAALMPEPAAAAAPAVGEAVASRASAPVSPPDVKVAAVSVKDFDVHLEDQAAPRVTQLALRGLRLSVKDVTLAEGARMPVDVVFNWAPEGEVHLGGTVCLRPLAAELSTEVDRFALAPLAPYIEQFANVHLTRGAVSAKVTSVLSLAADKPLEATVSGEVSLDQFGLLDAAHDEDLAGVSALTLRGLQAKVGPEIAVSVEELGIKGPYARVIVAPDGSLNVVSLSKSKPVPVAASAPETAQTATPVPPVTVAAGSRTAVPNLEIGRITISDGDFRFVDHAVKPGVNVAIAQFGGTVTGLSSAKPGKGTLDLHGVVDGAGPVAITGRLDPLGPKPFVELKVDAKNVDLVPLTPYSGKYAGYELARGKLVMDVKLLLDGRKIDASNVVTLNQFTFGNAVQSPDATKLPVRLAVALLKDIDGRIVVDLPVQGDMDDPEFRIGRTVLRVIGNLLTKAAVSPFALLGSAFGGGEELAYQDFAPGAWELQQTGIAKLDTMVKALTNRPALNLDLEGGYDAAADAHALKRVKLADRVKRAVWEARRNKDPNTPPPDALVVSPEEYAAMVKKLFDETFPPGTKFGTPLPAAPAIVAPPPGPGPGLFTRVLRAVTFSERRTQRKAEEERARVVAEHEKAVAAAIATGLPVEEMSGRLAEVIVIDENDLAELAQKRAQKVRDYLVAQGRIAPDRLFLSNAATKTDAAGKGPRVFLTLQ